MNRRKFWSRSIYNHFGKLQHYEDSDGDVARWEYDRDGRPVYYENNSGYREWYEWDIWGNLLSFVNTDGLMTKPNFCMN